MITFPHGETNVTLACQNRCVSCNHFIPAQKPWFCDPAVVERDLNAAAKMMHFDVYNLVGGEPMLHPAVVDLMRIVKASGITNRMEITSNGQAARKMPDEFWSELDDLIVTPYKLNEDDKAFIADKCQRFGVYLQWHPVIFTWAAYKRENEPQRAHELYRHCWYNVNRHVIDEGYFYRCCTAPFIPSVLMGLPKETDGIALEGLTEDGLREYMNQVETPKSCYRCASNCGAQIPWRETSRENWLDESLG